MKVLYIGNYRDGTGWGNAAMYNIMAMHRAGINVVCRSITYNNKNLPVPVEVEECESNDTSNVDVCIQHTLPENYVYNGSFKNICIYETETPSFRYTKWNKYINQMDEAWVPNELMLLDSGISGVKIPLYVVPHAINFSLYENLNRTSRTASLDGTFNFCFVGELIKRKNIGALIKAFHLEFHPSEQVNLFLKISKSGMNSDECMEYFVKWHASVTQNLKVRGKYKDPVVLAGYENHNNLLSLMSQCHSFVCSSYGEAFCYPALEAMALGIPVIHTNGIGCSEFVRDTGYAVRSRIVPCYEAMDSMPDVYSSNDNWVEIDIDDLKAAMRNAYNSRNLVDKEKIINQAKKFDVSQIGDLIKRTLNVN